MFYCKPCQVKNDWPWGLSGSYGRCEICGTVAVCTDVPSSYLPVARREDQPEKEIDA